MKLSKRELFGSVAGLALGGADAPTVQGDAARDVFREWCSAELNEHFYGDNSMIVVSTQFHEAFLNELRGSPAPNPYWRNNA